MIKQLFNKRLRRFGSSASQGPDLILHLGDSAARGSWSAVSGRIPTFRTGGGKFWVANKNRWLTGREKMCALGLPVTVETAAAMGVPLLQVNDTSRAHAVSGNSMHFSTVGVIQLVALSCFAKVETAYPLQNLCKKTLSP